MAAVAEHAMTPVDGAFVEGKENEEKVGLAVPDQVDAEAPQQQKKETLVEMFEQGGKIETARNSNLFQELQERKLTDKEEEIVKARTAHMQKMFEEYEKREKKRKVEELLVVCPDMNEKEIEVALDMYDDNEEEAAMALTSDANLKQRVRNIAGGGNSSTRPAAAGGGVKRSAPQRRWQAPSDPKGGIYIGRFGSKASFQKKRDAPSEEVKASAVVEEAKAKEDMAVVKPAQKSKKEVLAQPKDERRKKGSKEIRLRSPTKSPCENAKIDDIVGKDPKPAAENKAPSNALSLSPTKRPRSKRQRGSSPGWSGARTASACDSETKSLPSAAALTSEEPGSVKSSGKTKAARQTRTTPIGKAKKLEFNYASAATIAENEPEKPSPGIKLDAGSPSQPASSRAVASARGGRRVGSGGRLKKPSLGRVRQKSTKRGEVVDVGTVRFKNGWHNRGYIFPEGFKAKTPFRSSVELDQLVIHWCTIVGEGGKFWPLPTFKIQTDDRPDEPFYGKSATACWSAILKRINSEIEKRRAQGEDLPPPPKTAIAGPEYFGLNQEEVMRSIEAQDPERQLALYWAGKEDREEYIATGLVKESRVERVAKPRVRAAAGGGGSRKRKSKHSRWSDSENEDGNFDCDEDYGKNRWNSVNRSERYKTRCKDRGDKNVDEIANVDNPLPGFIDPITLEPVVNPAISPFGHVMGVATWRAVLDEQGKCPFTKKDLKMMHIKTLTETNFEQYKDKIVDL